LLGDQTQESCIIRTSIIGEAKGGNNSLLEWAKKNKGKKVKGYMQHFWNGITCLEWAKLAYEIISGKMKVWKGPRHISSDSVISKTQLLGMISDIYDLDLEIVSTRTEYCNMTLTSNWNNNIRRTSLIDQIQEMKDYDISSK
jgi:dTDP-4-dehydrorhamnose reductase